MTRRDSEGQAGRPRGADHDVDAGGRDARVQAALPGRRPARARDAARAPRLPVRLRRRLERAHRARSSSTTSSRACAPASGAAATRRTPPRRRVRARSRPSTSTPPLGCRRRSTASSATSRSMPTREADYRSRLAIHLLPFFGEYRLDEIDRRVCLAFKAHKLQEAAELRRAIDAGAELRDRRGRRVRRSGRRRSASSSTASPRSSTRPSTTGTWSATPRAASACASRCPSRRGRSSRWTSSWRSSTPPASRTRSPVAALARPDERLDGRAPKSPSAGRTGMRASDIAAELGSQGDRHATTCVA